MRRTTTRAAARSGGRPKPAEQARREASRVFRTFARALERLEARQARKETAR